MHRTALLSGTLYLNGGAQLDGAFSVAAGARLDLAAGPFAFTPPVNWTNAGEYRLTGGTLTLDRMIPNLQLLGGTLSLAPAFQGGVITNLPLAGASLTTDLPVTGMLTVAGSGVANLTTALPISGTLRVADNARVKLTNTVTGTMIVTNNGAVSGPLVVASGAQLVFGGGEIDQWVRVESGGLLRSVGMAYEKWLRGGITNAGTVLQSGYGLRVLDGKVAVNQPGALWETTDDSSVIGHLGTEVFYNQGTLRKSGGTGVSAFNPRLVNSGLVEVLSGTLYLNDGGFTMPDGLLRFGISSSNTFGKIQVQSEAILGGGIDAFFENGFVPEVGTNFQVMTFPSHAGTFTNAATAFYVSNGRGFAPVLSSTDLTLLTVNANPTGPEPDLQVTGLAVLPPTSLLSGNSITVLWTNMNTGSGATSNSWQDRLVVSNATVGQLLLVTNVYYDAATLGNLAAGASTVFQCNLRLPDGQPGAGLLTFSVTADINNTIAEYNPSGSAELNNTATSLRNSGLAPYPDLVVTAITTPSNGPPGQPIPIIWSITNQGSADAVGLRTDLISLSDDSQIGNDQALQTFDSVQTIPAGGSISVTQSVILPGGLVGDRYFVVTVNSSNRIFELVTTNNTAIATQPLATLNPDLIVQSVAAPGAAQLGQSITVGWVVQNIGAAVANVHWSDGLYLSPSPSDLAGAVILQTQPSPHPLLPATGYTNSQPVALPLPGAHPPGGYFIVVVADVGGVQPEFSKTNNLRSKPITLLQPPLPDLAATNITFPASVTPGQTVPVSWTVANRGTAAAVGPSSETLHLSAGPMTANNQLVGFFTFTNALPSGGFLIRTQQVTIPVTGVSGDLYLMVSVDVQNTVVEANETNNVAFSTNTIHVAPGLTLTVPVTQILENAPNPNIQASISRNGDISGPLAVQVSSSDPTTLSGPGTVTIPAGQTSASLSLTVHPDGIVASDKVVTITASASGFTASMGVVTVVNTDLPRLTVSPALPMIVEGATVFVAVTRDLVTTQDLTLTLVSSSPAHLLVPNLAIIPANSSSTAFPVLAVDDTEVEQLRTYTITASAGGYANGAATISVQDNDLPVITLDLASSSVSEGAGLYATTGTIRRNVAPGQLYLAVRSSDVTAARVPATLLMAPGQLEVSFPIAAVDDLIVDGPQTTVISVFALDAVSGQQVGPAVSRQLIVTDDDGPTLTLSILNKVVAEGLSPATTATVRRNTSTTTNLLVTLSSSNTNEATVPLTVTIPAGQGSVSFPIDSIQDGVTDGSKLVTISANADGFTSGNDKLLVTDVDLPDLVVSSVAAPAVVETDASFSLSYQVANQGSVGTAAGFVTRTYLSTDPVGSHGTLVDEYTNQAFLAPGQFFGRTLQLSAPSAVGQYWVTVDTDIRNDVAEILENNNFRISATPLSVQPAYRATIHANSASALPGTPIVLGGQALRSGSGSPDAGVLVNLFFLVGGTSRLIPVTTDANGNFLATFTPLPGESGDFTVIAAHPGESSPVDHGNGNTAYFTLLGMRLDIPNAYQTLVEHETWLGRFTLQNLSSAPLTGLAVQVTQKPDNITVASVSLEQGNTLSSHSANTLAIQLFANNTTRPIGEVLVRVTSDQGVTVDGRIYTFITPQRAQLAAAPSALDASMVRGRVRAVEFNVGNMGAAPTGPLTLLLPSLSWLASPLGQTLPSLAPGETRTISLSLNPPADLPLTIYQGSVALSCPTAQLSLPFSFRCVSDATADLAVTAVDEFFYYGAGAPKLTNALVRLLDPFTSIEVARASTGTNGVASFTALAEGAYTLEVSADKHFTYRNTVALKPGMLSETLAFLSRQTVTYVWTVEPVQIEEQVKISVQAIFETDLPIPVIVVTPTLIDLSSLAHPGQTMQVDVRIANHGLIAWQGVNIAFEANPNYELVPLIGDVGVLAAQSEVIVPVIARRKVSANSSLPRARKTPSDGSCIVNGSVCGDYPCGPRRVENCTPIQGYASCPPSTTPPTFPSGGAGGGGSSLPPVPPVLSAPGQPVAQATTTAVTSPIQLNTQPPCNCPPPDCPQQPANTHCTYYATIPPATKCDCPTYQAVQKPPPSNCPPIPQSTPCITVQQLPPPTPCDCPSYRVVYTATPCDDGDPCTVHDRCQNGVCTGDPIRVNTVDAQVESKNEVFVIANQSLSFTVTATAQNCTGLSYEWDFGDGTAKAKSQNPTHSYATTGDYIPSVKVECPACPKASVQGSLKVHVVKVEMAMDGNRDGIIDFENPQDHKYLFWVNDDVDKALYIDDFLDWAEDDKETGTPNCDDDVINGLRDLEDFTRLHIRVDANTANLPGITYWLKFDNILAGTPAVNIFEAVDSSLAYLTDGFIAFAQMHQTKLLEVGAAEHQLQNQYINAASQLSYFILEGKVAGKGDLVFTIKMNGLDVFSTNVVLDLRPITSFYEKYVVTGTADGIVGITSSPQLNTYNYQPESHDYLLFVHGWNIAGWETDRWTETVFKRLWWQGYKGHVGEFQWPTLLGIDTYDQSELRAWRSATALNDCIALLNTTHMGQVRVLAHSMGNVVMGEALLQSPPGQVHTYIAAQAAIPAHCYDNRSSNYWTGFTTPNVYGFYPSGQEPSAPYLSGNAAKAGALFRYFNTNDYALGALAWELNNEQKPDSISDNYHYVDRDNNVDTYSPSSGFPDLGDEFYRDLFPFSSLRVPLLFDGDRYLIFARCAQSRSRALGSEPREVAGFVSRNLQDPAFGFDGLHYSHSREFRSNIVREWPFWAQVMKDARLSH